ncbi:hypothetical protein RRF57_008447 [Xylaria bambusicola]|uniref:Cytochrome P450 n=1 Tax=Xylaria bambusicola TaxID=326684 RepID=A0AAN7UTJ3_9PEZI
MLGEPLGLLLETGSETAAKLRRAFNDSQKGVILRIILGKLALIVPDPSFYSSCQYIRNLVKNLLEKSQKDPESYSGNRKTLLQLLTQDIGDPIGLHDHIVQLLLAAGDTTGNLLSFTFFTLARRPDVWAKLRQDVIEHYCEPLTIESVKKMTYVRDVLRECEFLN